MKAVSVLKVEKILPVFKLGEPANAIEVIRLCDEDGNSLEFNIIAGKGLNDIGDYGLYIMPDYCLSERNEFMEYLAPGGDPTRCKLGKGNRIKAIKFNFTFEKEIEPIYSNGIFINLKFLPKFDQNQDLQEFFGIIKYVAEDNTESMKSGLTKGELPNFLYATDETRIETLKKHVNMIFEEGEEIAFTLKRDGCLDENTLIETKNDGFLTIKYICDNKYKGYIKTYNVEKNVHEYKKIKNHSILENINNWYEIVLEDDKKLLITGNHYIWCVNLNCYRKVEELTGEENLLLS